MGALPCVNYYCMRHATVRSTLLSITPQISYGIHASCTTSNSWINLSNELRRTGRSRENASQHMLNGLHRSANAAKAVPLWR